ncbi:MAG TPA: hypothetical protein DIU15_06090 [Deltaproteobacteria bacterium]|nr:hypothetical protein [Deltaproteobacteria bacterium]
MEPTRPQAKQTRKQRGQFFTPRAVAKQLLQLASTDLGERCFADLLGGCSVLDPACGDGAFLEAALDEGWASDATALTGFDLDDTVIAGPAGATLEARDSLRSFSQLRGGFDVALGNPPYGGDGVRNLSRGALSRLGRDFETWRVVEGGRPLRSDARAADRLLRFPIATLFAELFVGSVRPGGVSALVLPESFFANRRDGPVRAWLLRQARLISLTELPPNTFAGAGTRARTIFVVLQRRPSVLRAMEDACAQDPPVRLRRLGASGFETERSVEDLQRSYRWDPGYHDPAWLDPTDLSRLPCRRLGEFIETLAYGAIRVGQRPRLVSAGGALYVTQRSVADWGVDLDLCPRIAEEPPFVAPRFRLAPGDLVVPRCGRGTLGRNRLTRFDGSGDLCAVVDCFTDRVSLVGISSAWVLGVLRSELGWSQIRRTFNGVGTPNLSFGEIRALQVPVPDDATAVEAERIWAAVGDGTEDIEALRALVRTAIN